MEHFNIVRRLPSFFKILFLTQIAMRVFLAGFAAFLVFAVFSRWYFVCQVRHHCGDEPAVVTRPLTLSLKDGEKIVLQGYEEFSFPAQSFKPDISPNNEEFLQKTAEYLQQNTGKNITLTGRYLQNEQKAKTGIFENPGIARAAAVERALEKLGVDEKRITIDYELAEGESPGAPLSFALYTPETEQPEAYQKLQFSFLDNTFSDANFEYNKAGFNPGEQCRAYLDSVKIYLGQHPEKMLTITGHTDSIGSEAYNYDLGLRRANEAAKYFKTLGVSSTISVTSKGETQPADPNSNPDGTDNPAGREKNRRVNFKIEEKM
jgi:outer membrane protein OmpA-like peptidoglycan-associated protein